MTNIYTEIKEEYESQIGEAPEDSRKRRAVEIRAALSNAMHPVCHYNNISSLWNRDRTSIYNYVRQHETYYMSSVDYRGWYATATEIVNSKIDLIPTRRVSLLGKLEDSPHAQLETITRTISVLEEFRKRIERRV